MRLYRADIIDLQYASGPDGQTGKYADALIPERDEFFNETVQIRFCSFAAFENQPVARSLCLTWQANMALCA